MHNMAILKREWIRWRETIILVSLAVEALVVACIWLVVLIQDSILVNILLLFNGNKITSLEMV